MDYHVNMQRRNISVIGPIAVDIIITLKKNNKQITTSAFGGKGYNISKSLALFKMNTNFYSMVGKDKIGHEITQLLGKQNIKSHLHKISGRTPFFVGINDDNGNILFDKIDTSLFGLQQLPKSYHPGLHEIIIVTSSTNKKVLNEVFKRTQKNQIYILSISGSKELLGYKKYLKKFDIIMGNRKEFNSLGQIIGCGNNINCTFKKLAKKYTIQLAIATDTDKGISYALKDDKGLLINNITIKKLKAISTIGAGDSFLGAFVSLYYKYEIDLFRSIKLASYFASQTVKSHRPTIDKIPSAIKKIIF